MKSTILILFAVLLIDSCNNITDYKNNYEVLNSKNIFKSDNSDNFIYHNNYLNFSIEIPEKYKSSLEIAKVDTSGRSSWGFGSIIIDSSKIEFVWFKKSEYDLQTKCDSLYSKKQIGDLIFYKEYVMGADEPLYLLICEKKLNTDLFLHLESYLDMNDLLKESAEYNKIYNILKTIK
jgi:hypothetical protein